MSSARIEPSALSKRSQGKAWPQLLAGVLGMLPLYSILIVYELRRDQPISIQGFAFYLAVISPLAIVVALLLLRFLCRENYRNLNLKPAKLSSDLIAALILCFVILVANVVSNRLLSALIPDAGSNTSVRSLFAKLAGNPALLVLFAGPLFFLGAASEEVIRVFVLSRLWKAWPATAGKLLAVVISACLFGLIHAYRGPVHVGWTSLLGLIMGFYYLRFGRALPLILAHYTTNALQAILFAALAR
jgi:membrane protease YdiL (CAAX protease family)